MDTRVRVLHKGAYLYGIEDVGMQVPYCKSLLAIDPGHEPEPRPAMFSSEPAIRAALDAAHPELALSAPLPSQRTEPAAAAPPNGAP